MLDLLFLLVLAHLTVDFLLQSDKSCRVKYDPILKKRLAAHFKHALVYLLVSLILIMPGHLSLPAVIVLTLLASTHGLLDLGKSFLARKYMGFKLLLFDQVLHIITIVLAVWILYPGELLSTANALIRELLIHRSLADFLTITQKASLGISLLIFVTAGANVIIREVLTLLNITMGYSKDSTDSKEDAIKTGRYIGGIERVLTIIAMLAGSYEGIIALYASKTAIRFKHASASPEFEEYYILGTLLSLLFGIISGIILKIII